MSEAPAPAPGGFRGVLARVPRSTARLHLAVFFGLLLVSVLVWWHVWITGSPTSTLTCQCGDPSQALWFLSWSPFALTHGLNPFFSDYLYAGQGGVNMLANTGWLVPSVLLAPVTWLFGPVATFNVAATLGPAVTGWAFFVAARKVSTNLVGQVLGALLYGFSPFMVWNDPVGHLNFTLLFFAPLAFVLLVDLFVVRAHRPVVVGVLLGLLVVVQFFTGTEYLVMCVLVGGIGALAGVAMAPRTAWAHRRRSAVGLGTAAGVAGVLLAYPVWFATAGPRHVVGYPWRDSPALGQPWSVLWDPGTGVHGPSAFDIQGGYFGGGGPNFGTAHVPNLSYLGIPLLVFLVVSSVTWFRSRLAWSLVVMFVASWALSLGTSAGTEFDATPQLARWAPWRLFARLPLVEDVLPIRFGALLVFCAALLLALSVAGWVRVLSGAAARRRHAGERGGGGDGVGDGRGDGGGAGPGDGGGGRAAGARPRWVPWLVGVVAAATLVPIGAAYALPYTVRPSPTPAWFTGDARDLPQGTTVLVVPFANQTAMGWQAQAGLRFRLAGGFAVVPAADGRSQFLQSPTGAVARLDRLSPLPNALPLGPPPSSTADVASVRAAVERWGVDVVVVTRVGGDPTYSAGFMTAVLGRVPEFRQGVWVWDETGGAPPLAVGTTTLADCNDAHRTDADPLAVPDCVLASAPPLPVATAGPGPSR